MKSDVEAKVRLLAGQCQDLARNIRSLARSEEPSAVVEERLRRALVHVDLALEAVEHRAEDRQAAPSGRLLSRFSGMVDRLAGGGAGPGRQANVRAKLAGSIASLRQVAAPTRKGGIRGNSATISIPDFLGFLQVQGKTGLLEILLPNERVTMYVSRGDLVEAFSDNSPSNSRLGEILVEQGAIDMKTLNSFFVYHTKSHGRLGRALEVHELVTEEQLRAALTEQVVRMVRRMLEASDAPFVFHEGRIDDSATDFRLGVIELLLESARLADEASRPKQEEPRAALPSARKGEDGDEVEEIDLDDLRAQIDRLSE